MRIFHIITHFDIGGAERVAVNIAKSQTTGMEYHLVEVVRGNGEFSQAFILSSTYKCNFLGADNKQ